MPYLFRYHGTQKNNKIYIKHNEKKQQQTNVILRRTFHCSWTLQRTVLPDPAASDLAEFRPRRSGVFRAGVPASGSAARRRWCQLAAVDFGVCPASWRRRGRRGRFSRPDPTHLIGLFLLYNARETIHLRGGRRWLRICGSMDQITIKTPSPGGRLFLKIDL
jgi:hypothetical protein